MLAGQATDVVLDPDSGIVLNPDTGTDGQGNLQIVYAAIRGEGVFMSPNQGQVWSLMAGGVGNPLIVDTDHRRRTPTRPTPARRPTAPRGGSSWPCRPRPATPPQDADLRGLALRRRRHARRRPRRPVRDQGLRPELDQGRASPPLPPVTSGGLAVQPGDPDQRRQPARLSRSSARPQFPQGNYDISLAVDPTNPNVVYLGGTADGNADRPDPGRPHRDLGRPLAGRLLRPAPRTAAR